MSNLHNLATRTTDCVVTTLDAGASSTAIVCNAVRGRIVRTGSPSLPPAVAFTAVPLTITNNRVGPDSVIVVNVVVQTGVTTQIQTITVTNGQFVLGVAPNTTANLTAYTFDFYVLNPVCSR